VQAQLRITDSLKQAVKSKIDESIASRNFCETILSEVLENPQQIPLPDDFKQLCSLVEETLNALDSKILQISDECNKISVEKREKSRQIQLLSDRAKKAELLAAKSNTLESTKLTLKNKIEAQTITIESLKDRINFLQQLPPVHHQTSQQQRSFCTKICKCFKSPTLNSPT
jgi:chromosome segregation ATPase